MTAAVFTCPTCLAVSYNPNDAREGYCGRCHKFTGHVAPPPTDVQFVLHDGRSIPVDCIYVGVGDDGTRLWRVLPPDGLRRVDVAAMTIEALPGRTTIGVDWPDEPRGEE